MRAGSLPRVRLSPTDGRSDVVAAGCLGPLVNARAGMAESQKGAPPFFLIAQNCYRDVARSGPSGLPSVATPVASRSASGLGEDTDPGFLSIASSQFP
jgi:hypothetical protein